MVMTRSFYTAIIPCQLWIIQNIIVVEDEKQVVVLCAEGRRQSEILTTEDDCRRLSSAQRISARR